MSYAATAERIARTAAEHGETVALIAARATASGLDALVVAPIAAAARGLGAEPPDARARVASYPDAKFFLADVADVTVDLMTQERLAVATGSAAQQALRAAHAESAAAMARVPPDAAGASAAASKAADAQAAITTLAAVWPPLFAACSALDAVPAVYQDTYEGALRTVRSGTCLPRDGRFVVPERPRAVS